MKKIIFVLMVLFFVGEAFAGQTIEHKRFFKLYDPTTSWVYGQTTSSSTGDQIAVNTYTQKTIQISSIDLGEYFEVKIEGRSMEQRDTPNWALLDYVGIGAASSDTSRNIIVDVTEYVDFLRIGIRSYTSGNSRIDVEGIFTNLER